MTWQPKAGELKPGEAIAAAYPRKMEAISMRRTLRQTAGVACALRRLAGEQEQRWCLIVRGEDAK